MDPGKDNFTTTFRETREEAGYCAGGSIIYQDQIKILEYKVKATDKIVVYCFAELRDASMDPILLHEHTELRWLA